MRRRINRKTKTNKRRMTKSVMRGRGGGEGEACLLTLRSLISQGKFFFHLAAFNEIPGWAFFPLQQPFITASFPCRRVFFRGGSINPRVFFLLFGD